MPSRAEATAEEQPHHESTTAIASSSLFNAGHPSSPPNSQPKPSAGTARPPRTAAAARRREHGRRGRTRTPPGSHSLAAPPTLWAWPSCSHHGYRCSPPARPRSCAGGAHGRHHRLRRRHQPRPARRPRGAALGRREPVRPPLPRRRRSPLSRVSSSPDSSLLLLTPAVRLTALTLDRPREKHPDMEMKLTIRRVPTVVSNYQDDADKPRAGCGRNCLGDCCLPASKLPLYAFKANPTKRSQEDAASTNSLVNILLTEWEDRMARGLFRYDVTACETKVIPGNLGFVAQLNEGRHLKKRPTEFRVDRVLQPFDPAKFNFTKVGQEEVLFQFENGGGEDSYFLNSAPITAVDRAPNVVAINVSPIEYGHVLLIPRVLDRLPQRIDPESFLLALQMAAEAASPDFRLGYNSLGAFATINHLHFQAYYLSVPFPVEKAATHKILLSEETMKCGVTVSKLINYPVRGLVFEGGNTLNDLANVVSSACIWLQDNNVPYNVLISDCGKRVFLFPQCYAEKQALGEVSQELLDTQVNPAVWEISGHIVLKRRNDYEEASETSAWKLLAEVSLSEDRFEEVKAYIFSAAGLVQSDEEEVVSEGEDTTYAPAPVAPLPVAEGCLVLQ